MLRALLAGVLLAGAARAEDAVAPRPLVAVEAAVLRLGDLFEGTGPRAGTVIGTAPAPGHRLVVEAAQLLALARIHGLPWRPLSAAERVVVERPGRTLGREEILAAVREALLRAGMEESAELDLGPLAPPVVPPEALAQVTVEGVSIEPGLGRFSATLVVLAEGVPSLRQRITGRVLATQPAIVAARRLSIGEVVGPADLREVRLRADRLRPGLADRPDQVLGQQLRRPLAPDAPFALADVAPRTLVEKNALVTLLVDAPGLSATAQGRALEGGPRGGVVPVMNLASRAIVEGQVVGPGRVRVAIGATPISQ